MKKRAPSEVKPAPAKKTTIDRTARADATAVAGGTSPSVSSRLPAPSASPSKASEKTPVSIGLDLRRVRFGLFEPDAREVYVVGSFNDWNQRATPLLRDALGDWSVEIALPPGEYHYRLMVDGTWRDDPSAQQTAMNPFGGFDAVLTV